MKVRVQDLRIGKSGKLGDPNLQTIETWISLEKFEIIHQGYKNLVILEEVDELYRTLLFAYFEFENEHSRLLNEIDILRFSSPDEIEIRRMNLRLLTFLTAARCFFEISKKHVLLIQSDGRFDHLFDRHNPKESNFSFMLVEFIRNISQHHLLPIHNWTTGFRNKRQPIEKQEIYLSFSFSREKIKKILDLGRLNKYDINSAKKILDSSSEEELVVSDHISNYMLFAQSSFKEFLEASDEIARNQSAKLRSFLDQFSPERSTDFLSFKGETEFHLTRDFVDNFDSKRLNASGRHIHPNRTMLKRKPKE